MTMDTKEKEHTGGTDPIGAAISDYVKRSKPGDIIVKSDICDDDILPVELLFREFSDMPDIEQLAIQNCGDHVLDVGAGAGAHAKMLISKGKTVHCIDTSKGAVAHMKEAGLEATCIDFFDLNPEPIYDTVLMLMNGIGIAGKLSNLEKTLSHAIKFLKPGGNIICDSSDIKYLYQDEDGSLWIDLNTDYYGNFRFQMVYKNDRTKWFDWLYVDFDSLFQVVKKMKMHATKFDQDNEHYLAIIK